VMVQRSRRVYGNLIELVKEMGRLMPEMGQVGQLMRGDSLDPAFRERLMLAVTAVNDCRYCSYSHARQALTLGVTPAEIEALAGGEFNGCPPEELPALLYAQHWAEMDGDPDPAARLRVSIIYGDQKADVIELALRVIRIGNLGGNTLDHILHRLSFGRLGIDAHPSSPSPVSDHA